MAEKELGPGSEGDAYRYTKKVLLSLPNVSEIRRIYTEIAENRNISSWTRACYEELRRQFFRDGQCKIKFAPGVARVAYGELLFGTGDEDFRQLADLRDFVRIISIAHFTEFTRHLAVDGRELSFKDLVDRFGNTVAGNWKELKRELAKVKYGPRRYRVIWLDSFQTAHGYYEYTKPHNWCHLGSESMFRSYSYNRKTGKDGNVRLSVVKLYLAVLPGFEDMTEDDPLYGESMLGIDIGPDGRLLHVNNRWNHSHDSIDERKGDNKYSEKELSELLGGPFYKICTPFSRRDYRHIESSLKAARRKSNAECESWARCLANSVSRAVSARGRSSSTGTFTDSRDGTGYRTGYCGNTRWMLDPLRIITVGQASGADFHREDIEREWAEYDLVKEYPELEADDGYTLNPFNGDPDADDADPMDPVPCKISRPKYIDSYVPLVSVDLGDTGKAKVYLSSDVATTSLLAGDSRGSKDEYAYECAGYRRWRAEHIDAGENCLSEDGTHVVYQDDNFFGVFEDEYSAMEMITPLGFSRSSWADTVPSAYRIIVNDTDSRGKFVFYRGDETEKALPEGWRLPTVSEFMAMAMRNGATAVFGDRVSQGKFDRSTGESEIVDEIDPGCGREELRGRLLGTVLKREKKVVQAPVMPAIFTVAGAADDLTANVGTAHEDDEYGFSLDEDVPPSSIRLPMMRFSMRDSGFSFPDSPRHGVSAEETAKPILLTVDRRKPFESAKAMKGFAGRMHSFDQMAAGGYFYLRDDLDDFMDALGVVMENMAGAPEAANTLYAEAVWRPDKGSFEIRAVMPEDLKTRHYALYCVRRRDAADKVM